MFFLYIDFTQKRIKTFARLRSSLYTKKTKTKKSQQALTMFQQALTMFQNST